MSPNKIIFVNGAPGSGKDTFYSSVLLDYGCGRGVVSSNFKKPLIEAAQAMSFAMPWEWTGMYTREEKEKPQELLYGMSPREMLIWISEEVMKPKFGKDVFGQLMVKEILHIMNEFQAMRKELKAIIIPDAGFKEEIQVVVDEFGQENCALVNIIRPGHDFSNDSRSLISGEDVGIKDHHVLYNTEDLKTFKEGCVVVFDMIMGYDK